jgi:HAMP domain-containing protein
LFDRLCKWLKQAKDLYSWGRFWAFVVTLLVPASMLSGLVVFATGILGAIRQGVPWPIIVMAGFCTFVAAAYLAVLPRFITAVNRLATAAEAVNAQRPKKEPPRPNYKAWKHVEKFSIGDAALLWEDIDPNANIRTVFSASWVDAFCAAVRKGEIEFIPKFFSAYSQSERDRIEERQRKDADSSTDIPRKELIRFAAKHGERPPFLAGEIEEFKKSANDNPSGSPS